MVYEIVALKGVVLMRKKPAEYVKEVMIRVFDIFLSIAGIIILSPLLLLIALAVILDSGYPVLFKQERVGLHKRHFRILKFRTMTNNSAGTLITVGADCRVTRIGKFLRATKMDELPQLFNVIKGDMALVGPRPEVPEYVKHYLDAENDIFSVRPGITDYASILYRRECDLLGEASDPEYIYINEVMRDKLRINLEYMSRRSLWGNLKVILLTVVMLFK